MDLRAVRIYNHPGWYRLGQYVHARVGGAYDVMWEYVWRNELVHVFKHRGIWYWSATGATHRKAEGPPPGFVLWHENYDGEGPTESQTVWAHSGLPFDESRAC